MRFRKLEIRVQTSDGPYGTEIEFPDGLVVIWADNSMGKSTCLKAILVALGLEAVLTTSLSDLPLPPSLKTRLQSDRGEHDVLESQVLLEIENDAAERVVIQRTIKGRADKNLVTVHLGPALTQPTIAPSTQEFFLNRQGSATRELGFHSYLSRFMGWSLPQVRTYDLEERPLYLQCIVPFLVVEQTRGWGTVQPPCPTHFRIRDVHKRVVEFLLNLDAYQVALRRQELQTNAAQIEAAWHSKLEDARRFCLTASATIQALPKEPTGVWPPTIPPSVKVLFEQEWIAIDERLRRNNATLTQLVEEEIPRVKDVATATELELNETEERLGDRQTLLARLLDELEMEEEEASRTTERLKAIDEDLQKNKDARVLRDLGSRQASTLNQGVCPVCHQTIKDALVPLAVGQTVMSVDQNIEFLAEQRRTYLGVEQRAKNAAAARSQQVRGLRQEVAAIRERVRILRQTLISDGRLPSAAAIQARLTLEVTIHADIDLKAAFDALLTGFGELARDWSHVQEALRALPKDDVTDDDRAKLKRWSDLIQGQLEQYGFQSFPPQQASISDYTYRPEHDGFDLQSSISASDLIRTIWSYLTGLLEMARSMKTNHPGFLVFDEPRQQSARDVSFRELLRRGARAGEFGQQVIFFTSEDRSRLKNGLAGLPHKLVTIEGRVLKRRVNASSREPRDDS